MLDSQKCSTNVGMVSFFPKIQWSLPNGIFVALICDACIGYQDVDRTKMVFGFLEA